MNTHDVHYGDSLTPIGLQLRRKNTAGVLSNMNLTGKTVKIVICQTDGTVVVDETETGVTVTSATEGQVSYDFPSGADALDPGTYYLYARVYGGTERDTYPVENKQLQIKVHAHENEDEDS